MTLLELLTLYVETNPSIRSEKTERLYKIVVAHFDKFMRRTAEVEDMTERNVTAYMRHRRNAKRAEITIENETVRLFVLWRFAAREGMIPAPKIKVLRSKPAPPRAPRQRDIRALFRAARRSRRMIKGRQIKEPKPVRLLYPALLGVTWNTLERINAIYFLHRSKIDLRRRTVTYVAETRKGNAPTITKPITRQTARALRRWYAVYDGDYPFQVAAITSLYHHFDMLVKEAGADPAVLNGFHALRRSGATNGKRHGGDMRYHLGHDEERTTNRHYIDEEGLGHKPLTRLLPNPVGLLGSLLAFFGL